MKKILLPLGVVAMLTMVSCKKDYSCVCDFKEQHDGHLDDEQSSIKIEKAKKADAEDACDAYKKVVEANPEHEQVSCELK